ncbi:hypothetical protein HGD85_01575 [Rhodobacteraceae bacterium R_SAG10]|nr:hypothetical protein [Rhodobacteraceae bacterium R_SAG10]
MCGIVGYSSETHKPDLDLALTEIAHRGPDGSGKFVDENSGVGLGHVRLSIIDLSPLGKQPMASDDERFVISYNGEIYNHQW